MTIEDLKLIQRSLQTHPRRGELVLRLISTCRRLGRNDLAQDWLRSMLFRSTSWSELRRAEDRRRRISEDGGSAWFMSSLQELLFYWPPERPPKSGLYAAPRSVLDELINRSITMDPQMLLDDQNELRTGCLIPIDFEVAAEADLRSIEKQGPGAGGVTMNPSIAREWRVIPLRRNETGLSLLSAEPFDASELTALSVLLRQPVQILIADSGRLRNILETFYGSRSEPPQESHGPFLE